MNAKERNKLQQYIGHCSNLDEQIRYIETVKCEKCGTLFWDESANEVVNMEKTYY